jgi:class 3 adenylate cyclase
VSVESLLDSELKNIEDYRSRHQTSVLTIMFTDIEGFTEMTERLGDEYSAKVRRLHDQILEDAIENNYDGKVIKHIGDAILAIFSEPSKAVLASLKIQKNLRAFNANKPEGILEDIRVRIGLHMGQVATEQSGGQKDIFGRHVNRASRVESMAAGGQIFLSNAVYDSAKGWIQNFENSALKWTFHGKFQAKGIAEGIDIYEVSDDGLSTHRPPRKPRVSNGITQIIKPLVYVALVLGIIASGYYLKNNVLKADVSFVGDPVSDLVLDGREKLVMEKNKVLSDITKGHHYVYYPRSNVVRYFMEFEIKSGKNLIPLDLKYSQMSDISLDWSYENPDLKPISNEISADFFNYDKNGKKQKYKTFEKITITPLLVTKENNKAELNYILKINDKAIIDHSEIIIITGNETKIEKEIYSMDDIKFYFSQKLEAGHVAFSLWGNFVDLPK